MPKTTIRTEFAEFKGEFRDLKNTVRDLVVKVDNLAVSVVELRDDMDHVENFLANEVMTRSDKNEIMATLAHDKNEIMTTLDTLIGLHRKTEQEQTLQTYRIHEHTDLLDRHDKEIKNLQLAIAE